MLRIITLTLTLALLGTANGQEPTETGAEAGPASAPSITVGAHELSDIDLTALGIEIAKISASPVPGVPPSKTKPAITISKHAKSAGAGSPDIFTLEISKDGVSFTEFMEAYASLTGSSFSYDQRKVQNQSIILRGKTTFRHADSDMVFQSLLRSRGYAIIPLGTPNLNMFLVEDIRTSPMLKQSATMIDIGEINAYVRQPARIVSVVIPLKYIHADEAQKALMNLVQEHRVETVAKVNRSNSLLITNFGPTVHAMWRLLQAMDVNFEPPGPSDK